MINDQAYEILVMLGVAASFINAMFWAGQWLDERRWRFIGHRVKKWVEARLIFSVLTFAAFFIAAAMA